MQKNTLSKISVCLATYNGEKYLKQQLESILDQSYLPDEVIVVDDASSDLTVEILKSFQEKCKSLHPQILWNLQLNRFNQGPLKSFNQALELAQGDFIFLCDQDDIWSNHKIELMLNHYVTKKEQNIIDKENRYLLYSDCSLIDDNGRIFEKSLFQCQQKKAITNLSSSTVLSEMNSRTTENTSSLFIQNVITGCCAMLTKELRDFALPIPHSVYMHDWWLGLMAANSGQLDFIPQQLVYYRQHSHNANGETPLLSLKGLRKRLDLSHMKKCLNYSHQYGVEVFKFLSSKNHLLPSNHQEISRLLDFRSISLLALSHRYKELYRNQLVPQGKLRQFFFFLRIALYQLF